MHNLKPGSAKTFKEYIQDVLIPHIEMQLIKAQRVHVICHTQKPDSLNEQIQSLQRERHASKSGTSILNDTMV